MAESPITEETIHDRVGAQSFHRGKRYYQDGHIFNARRHGNRLKALCHGSMSAPYQVDVLLDSEGVVAGSCSCPVGAGGYCKHTAALLLVWVHEPEAFIEAETLESLLSRRTKPELIALIQRMVDLHPDLETWLAAYPAEKSPTNIDAIHQLITQAFQGIEPYEWGAEYGVAANLLNVLDIGSQYIDSGDLSTAISIYDDVMSEVLDHYGMFHDESGELHRLVNECVRGLGYCLERTNEAAARVELLHTLFGVYRWDIDFGGIDIGYEARDIMLSQTSVPEQEKVIQWVQEALPTGDDWSSGYRRQAYGGFLLDLQRDRLDDETFLEICRMTERWHDLVDRLLALGRTAEAVAITRTLSDYDLLRLADVYTVRSQAECVETLIRERMEGKPDYRLLEWLKQHTLDRGDVEGALEIAEGLFWERPDIGRYRDLRSVAEKAGRWQSLRAMVLESLVASAQRSLLVEISLDEDNIDQALIVLDAMQAADNQGSWGYGNLQEKVAAAAEASRPYEAVRLYFGIAQRLIAARGRGNYAAAAQYLARIRDIYRRLGDPDLWDQLMKTLRDDYRRLPALQDELTQAGL